MTLFSDTLFGHLKGVFTGAERPRLRRLPAAQAALLQGARGEKGQHDVIKYGGGAKRFFVPIPG